MAVKCTNCGGAHPLWDCKKDPVEKKEKRLAPAGHPTPIRENVEFVESTPPKPKIGRPRTGFNKKEYNRQFTADLRTIKRLGLNCTVAQYRMELAIAEEIKKDYGK